MDAQPAHMGIHTFGHDNFLQITIHQKVYVTEEFSFKYFWGILDSIYFLGFRQQRGKGISFVFWGRAWEPAYEEY